MAGDALSDMSAAPLSTAYDLCSPLPHGPEWQLRHSHRRFQRVVTGVRVQFLLIVIATRLPAPTHRYRQRAGARPQRGLPPTQLSYTGISISAAATDAAMSAMDRNSASGSSLDARKPRRSQNDAAS